MARPDLPALAKAIAATAIFATAFAAADTLEGKIVGVSDGDTVTLLTSEHRQVKIRIEGIDAP